MLGYECRDKMSALNLQKYARQAKNDSNKRCEYHYNITCEFPIVHIPLAWNKNYLKLYFLHKLI